jgi:PAS domain S-box-containing protein
LGRCSFVILALVLCPLIALVRAAPADDGKKYVLMLHSSQALLPAMTVLGSSTRATLDAEAPGRVEIFPEFLDAVRFPGAEHEARMVALLREKYATGRIDLVLSMGPEALAFLGRNRAALFPGAAVICAGVTAEELQTHSLSNATGVLSRYDPVETLELALRLQPHARHLVVVTGASPFDRNWEAVARAKFRPYADRLDVRYLSGLPLPELLAQVARLPPNTILLYLTVFLDGRGERFVPREVAAKISAAANAPLYGVYDTYLDHGIVGGHMDTFEAVGREIARIGLRVLAGEPAESISPHEAQTHVSLVDWRQLQRWGMSEAKLPPGTVVRFRQQSLWERYSRQIAAVAVALLVQSLLIVGLLVQARRRRRAEQSLRESEERMGLAAESTNLGLWQVDPRTGRIWATEACRGILGLNPQGHLIAQSFIDARHPDDRRRATQICQDAVANGKSFEQEYRVVDPDGRVRWVLDRARHIRDATGKTLRIAGVVIDITDRRRAEEALRESEERYRNVVETQTELICRYLPDTTLTFVNDAYCRYFDRSRDRLVGTKFIDLVPKPAQAGILQLVESLLRNPRTEMYEHEVLRPDGTTGWQQWTDHVIVDSDGRAVEVQAIGRDTTALRRAELEAQERRKEVTHLTRVAILGELSGALAHELNQPLTAILSNAQAAQRLLAKTPIDLDEVRNILSDIGSDDKRAGDVIKRLRALMKKGETKLQALDLNDLATEVLELAHSELVERNVGVATRLAPGLPDVRGDRVQLQQVLLNLILNACEAMGSSNGTESVVEISTGRDGDGRLQLTVADRGPGIPPDLIDRVFEPFVTTKKQGLGLGLSICHSIVTAHGGRLWVTNNPGRGATFSVALPVHRGGATRDRRESDRLPGR